MSVVQAVTAGDTLIGLIVDITKDDGSVFDLTDFTVTLRLKRGNNTVVGPYGMSVADPASGVAEYPFLGTDLIEPFVNGQVCVTDEDGFFARNPILFTIPVSAAL